MAKKHMDLILGSSTHKVVPIDDYWSQVLATGRVTDQRMACTVSLLAILVRMGWALASWGGCASEEAAIANQVLAKAMIKRAGLEVLYMTAGPAQIHDSGLVSADRCVAMLVGVGGRKMCSDSPGDPGCFKQVVSSYFFVCTRNHEASRKCEDRPYKLYGRPSLFLLALDYFGGIQASGGRSTANLVAHLGT